IARVASVPHYLRRFGPASSATGPDIFNSGPWPRTHHRKMRGCRRHPDAAVPRTHRPRALLRERFRQGSDRTAGLLRSPLQDRTHGQRETGSRKLSQHPVVVSKTHSELGLLAAASLLAIKARLFLAQANYFAGL